MLKRELRSGCTLHYVADATIDTGPILGTHSVPADGQNSLVQNIASLYEGGTAMVAKTLDQLSRGETISTIPQNPAGGRYFSYPSEPAVAGFLGLGHRLYSKAGYVGILGLYGVNAAAARELASNVFSR